MRSLVAGSIVLLTLAAPTPGAADHISARIKDGTIQLVGGVSFLGTTAISGNHGFAFSARFEDGFTDALLCVPCASGETLSLSALIPTGDGTATYRGQTYQFNFNNGGGQILLQGPSFTLPAGTGTEPTMVEFETPFTVGDESFLFLQSGANGEIQHNLRLSGVGMATVRFQVFFDPILQIHEYWFDSIRFDFSKKPKPTE